jgi:probable phosphoglycerate mutase
MLADLPLLYVIRHGETDWNAEGRFQGSLDVPMNDKGRRQAAENGRLLRSILVDGADRFDFVSSPLSRSRETMEIIRSELAVDPTSYGIDERLIEVSFGDWEGSTIDQLSRGDPERISLREGAKWNFIPPGENAESYEIMSWRIKAWLESIRRQTICVSHGGTIRVLFNVVGGLAPDQAAEVVTHQDRILKIEHGAVQWVPPVDR